MNQSSRKASPRPLSPPRPLRHETDIEDGFHRLSERLQSAASYLEVLRAALNGGADCAALLVAEVANKAGREVDAAQDAFRHLRRMVLTCAAEADGASLLQRSAYAFSEAEQEPPESDQLLKTQAPVSSHGP